MKKALALLLAAAMSLSLASCGGGGTTPSTSNGDGSKSEIELNTGGVATAMENAAESVTVAVDDDSFTIGPWVDQLLCLPDPVTPAYGFS